MPCATEISSLPQLTGCPSDSEFFFIVNAEGGLGDGRYALRSVGDVRKCFLNNLKFGFLEIIVGVTTDNEGNIIMTDQDVQLIISQNNILSSSFWITDAGSEMPKDAIGVQSMYYGEPIYTQDSVTINFIQSFANETVIIAHYAYYI